MLGLSKPQISQAAEPGPRASKYHSLQKGKRVHGEMTNSRAAAGKAQDDHRIHVAENKGSAQKMIGTCEKDNRSHLAVASTGQMRQLLHQNTE